MSKPTSNNSKKPSASFNKKTRSRLAELAAQKKAKANDLEQKYPVPTEEETKQALTGILQGLDAGLTLQQILGLSDVLLEEIYTIAYSFYSQGKYNEAIGLFQILTASKPQCYKYILGLSSCYHQLKMYNEAAFGFFLAFDAEPNNPIPPYYIADSLMKIDQTEESKDFLDITIDICANKPEYRILKERCNIMKDSLKGKSADTTPKKKKLPLLNQKHRPKKLRKKINLGLGELQYE
ncbi:SycD/LcrH family type III secretion system chaperone [Chlamydia abortus]|uniref:SycD/LcrH family type III secretion system chaperone n=1 Tax=Chlamydia abortus TaxID=83555 RepID=UPI00223BE690|nr:SycD/LcrH family type III secretion system chaperone [Chlamydia abortus]